MVKTASLYDNFCRTGNYVIYDVIIWVQDGNCKKWLERILILVRSTHGRRFVLKFGGTTNGALVPPRTATGRTYVLEVGAGGGRPLPPRGPGGITPRKFLKITVQIRAILCKIGQYLCKQELIRR